jgi:hypothetical protein
LGDLYFKQEVVVVGGLLNPSADEISITFAETVQITEGWNFALTVP